MFLTPKNSKELEKLEHKLDKLQAKIEKEYELAKIKLRKSIKDKYSNDLISICKDIQDVYKNSNTCKRCLGKGYISYRPCAEADREEIKCPICLGSGEFSID